MQLLVTGIILAVNLILGFTVFLNNKKKPLNITFGLLVLSIAGWTISNYLTDKIKEIPVSLFWNRTSFAFAVLIATIFLIFSYLFTGEKKEIRRGTKILFGAVSAFVFALSFTPWIVKTVEIHSWGSNTINGRYFFIFAAYFLITMLAGIRKIIVQYNRLSGSRKLQIQYFFLGIVLSLAFGTSTNLIIPLISGSTELAKFGPLGTIFLIIFTSYAIVRHRLMDIRLLVLKSVAYSLSLAIIVGIYISLTYLAFQKLNLVGNHLAFDLVVMFALIFSFNPLRRFIEKRTDKLFFKGQYDFNELLTHLNHIARKNSRNIAGLTKKIMELLIKEMRVDKIAFILMNKLQITSVRVIGYKNKSRSFWDKVKLAEEGGTVVVNELDDDSSKKILLKEIGIELLLPIKNKQDIIGSLVLGEKKSGDIYSSRDIDLLQLVVPQIAIALENARHFKEKEQRISELNAINKMFYHIEHFLDLDKLLQEILDEAIKVTKAEGGSLMLMDKRRKKLSIKTARKLPPLISINTKIKIGEGIAGTVAYTREPLVLNGSRDKRFKSFLKREEIISAISVPMIANNMLIGVLNVNRQKNRLEFTEENLNVMTAFASQAAEVIVKASYYREIEKLCLKNDIQFREFTKALAKTVDAKDPYTYGHSEAVTQHSLAIGREKGLNEQQLRSIEIGGRLHDMGKIGIPEYILNKPGPLTKEEYTSIKRHPEIAADILKDTKSLKDIRDLILFHHERFDGSGYPAGLKGKDIPLGARILAVADTYDTITSPRPYRKSLSKKAAIEELKKGSGSQFDPEIVGIFIKILAQNKLKKIKRLNRKKIMAKAKGRVYPKVA